MEEELRYTIALMNMKGVGSMITRHLISVFGSAKAAFNADADLLANMTRIGQSIITQRNSPDLLERANQEITFMNDHHIRPLIYGQEGYPKRLKECEDAPALLFSLGNADLDNRHIVSIVGTRSCTQYGRDIVNSFAEGLKDALPDAIIVSGLALGIDGAAHETALTHGITTIGVLAHGLDRIYPPSHRTMASQIVSSGGSLITEYPSGTTPERCNYLIFNNFSFLSTSFFCKIPSLFIIKIIGQFGHIKKSIVNFCKNFQFFSLFSKNVPIWCPFTLPISL